MKKRIFTALIIILPIIVLAGIITVVVSFWMGNSTSGRSVSEAIQKQSTMVAQEAAKSNPSAMYNMAGFINGLGMEKQKNGDLLGAYRDFETAIKLQPEYVTAVKNRALCAQSLGEQYYSSAIVDYDRVLDLDPNNPTALEVGGLLKARLGDTETALEEVNRSVKKYPKYASSYCNRGSIKAVIRDYNGAIKDYEQAQQLEPDDPTISINLGMVYLKKKDYENALTSFEDAIELGDKSLTPWIKIAECKRKMSQYVDAITDYTKLIAELPNLEFLYYDRAECEKGLGLYDEALEDCKKALSLRKYYREPRRLQVEIARLKSKSSK